MSGNGLTKRVLESFQKIQENDFEAALLPACNAVAATAEKEYPKIKDDNQKFTTFIKSNLRIIGFVAFNINAAGFNLAIDHPKLIKKKDPETGAVPIEYIIYYAIRCGLVHECEIDASIEIAKDPNTIFSVNNGKLVIGQGLALGLLAAVILSPIYAGIKTPLPMFSRNDIEIPLHWGKKKWFINHFKLILAAA